MYSSDGQLTLARAGKAKNFKSFCNDLAACLDAIAHDHLGQVLADLLNPEWGRWGEENGWMNVVKFPMIESF